MNYRVIVVFVIIGMLINCNAKEEVLNSDLLEVKPYFPPLNNDNWLTESPSYLNWNTKALNDLEEFLKNENSKAFLVIVDGKIAVEKYFNNQTKDDVWQWNSAGKTLVTAITGIAQQNKILDINDKVSSYLGANWTNMVLEKEDLIKPYHLLTMTSGINDESNLVIPQNLTYLEDAGMRWSYHNVFQKLFNVIETVANKDFKDYSKEKLEDKIGMDGGWHFGPTFKIYYSNARTMARFGLLALHKGSWNEEQIIDNDFFIESINSSQNLNPSYGYMWWLNGKNSYMLPSSQEVYSGKLITYAPDDMYVAMGYEEQRIYVIPSKNMVIVRMGEASNIGSSNFAVSSFDNVFWEKFNRVIN